MAASCGYRIPTYLRIALVLTATLIYNIESGESATCDSALGMKSKGISDSQISASSYANTDTEAKYARLERDYGGGGWTSGSDDTDEWLAIELGDRYEVTKVATQGRDSQTEWVTSYTLMYSDNGDDWAYYVEDGLIREFTGNTDSGTVVTQTLADPIIAYYIRFNPLTWNQAASMRVEIYGCSYDAYTATFDGSAYIVYDTSNPPVETTEDSISFRFKTNRPDGVLLYGIGSQGDYMALQLIDGSIELNVNLGTSDDVDGTTSAVYGSLLDDNHWHTVSYNRSFKSYKISVDDIIYTSETSGEFLRLDIDTMLTFGGTSMFGDDGLSVDSNFIGCMEAFMFNGEDIIKSAQTSLNLFSVEGSLSYTCQGEVVVPITFPDYDSYMEVILDDSDGSDTFDVSFYFKSYDDSGLMLYHTLDPKGYIAIALSGGELSITISTATSTTAEISSGSDLNDGNWHSLALYIEEDAATLTLDGDTDEINRVIEITTGDTYQIGGGIDSETGFLGCMEYISVAGQTIDLMDVLKDDVDYGSVEIYNGATIDSCGVVDRCEPNPCEHEGVCSQSWSDFSCDCSSTGYEADLLCHSSWYMPSCQGYLENNQTSTMTYYVDPDLSGDAEPFIVKCEFDFTTNIATTIVQHDAMTLSDDISGSYSFPLTYSGSVDVDDIGILVDRSTSCSMYIEYDCVGATLLNSPGGDPYAWWISRQGFDMINWGGAAPGSDMCLCGVYGNCTDTSKWCNCDGTNDGTDSGYLTDKDSLPVKEILILDSGDSNTASFLVGELVCQGDSLYDNEATFASTRSSLWFNSLHGEKSIDIMFSFKTRSDSGVFIENQGSDNDFIKVELESSNTVVFTYNTGDYMHTVASSSEGSDLNDNDWHTVIVIRNILQAKLVLDGTEYTDTDSQSSTSYLLELEYPLVVGADSDDENGFVGVLRGMVANGEIIELYSMAEGDGGYMVTAGDNGRCDSDPCMNGATCLEYYSTFVCDCDNTAFIGDYCSEEVGAVMDEDSYILYTIPTDDRSIDSVEEVTIGFYTAYKQGILMSVANSDSTEYLIISINTEGGIDVEMEYGDDDPIIRTYDGDYTDIDDTFHVLYFKRDMTDITLQVDNYIPLTENLASDMVAYKMDDAATITVGKESATSTETGFSGCISRVKYNNYFPVKSEVYFESDDSTSNNIDGDTCGQVAATIAPYLTEPYSGHWPNETDTGYTGQQAGEDVDGNVIAGVVAVFILVLIFLLVFLVRYFARHKGSYHTHEEDGATEADDADTSILKAEEQTPHVLPQVEKGKEYFI